MSDLDQIELQRQRLEESVAKLRKSLQHWRTWDAEYEGLKEELAVSNSRTEEDCVSSVSSFTLECTNDSQIRISEQLEGELVNKQGQ